MIIYFDCEFTDLLDPRLISAGFVTEHGEELYFELIEHYTENECSPFVIEAVLPHLDSEKYGLMPDQAARTLQSWIAAFGKPVQLGTDAPAWDWSLIWDLLDFYGCMPANLSEHKNMNSEPIQRGYENYFTWQPLAIRHHALWDARALAYAAGNQ